MRSLLLSLLLLLVLTVPVNAMQPGSCSVSPDPVAAGSVDFTVSAHVSPYVVYGIEIRQHEGNEAPDVLATSDIDGNLSFTFTSIWPPGHPLLPGAATVIVEAPFEQAAKARCSFTVN